MIDIIRQLPETVANQIAAGEVVQRPASALKELVENSVDAGASEIQIVIKDAGRTLIQVVDNGKGMSVNDARMAFGRHATSKIQSADDLFALTTMGFRGEALASICAISQVEMKTCPRGESLGTRVIYSGGHKELQEPAVCTPGTNIMVRNLFYNVPARRKFLKSDNVELSAIMREFERLALVNNNIHLSINTGSRTIDLRPASFKARICDIWKNSLDPHLMPIEVDTSMVKISGFVSRPEHARRRNPLQFLIVNGRNMVNHYFRKAIISCFDGYIATDTQPCFFLKFEVDPHTIDVNISPTKSEIKFEHESDIRQLLVAAVRASLGKYGAAPSIDFTQDALQLNPARDGDFVSAPTEGVDRSYNPFRNASSASPSLKKQSTANWESLYTGFMSDGADRADKKSEPAAVEAPAPDLGLDTDTLAPLCIQCAAKYIVTPDSDGLLVIDQHRAHVKILYERYMRETADNGEAPASQRVAFPETLRLDPAQSAILDGLADEVSALGFTLEKSADNEYEICGIPASLKPGSARDAVLKIIDSVSDEGSNYGKDATTTPLDLRARIALVTARAAAIKRGQTLSAAEMEHIVGQLLSLPDPAHTPAGNPVFVRLPLTRLDALFL
ncbi:MAG: DNA mismatch repair endonuclease MutL [Prevotella sp.]|nr:DNA mismatch repair endonuclease MutL [Prevotella sp.]MCM1074426.1 DNA mismatch repair endonuclease MutL [Ruminococcus sp.]